MVISRRYSKPGTESVAVYSNCEGYRYSLTRVWKPGGPHAVFIMLNPSTATEIANDPTVERCERRARKLGFGAFRVCNIFAWRSTDPRALARLADPVGPGNDQAILEGCEWARQNADGRVICAWGNHGELRNRGRTVERLLRRTGACLHHLGLTATGQPRHPLYVGYARPLQTWQAMPSRT